jgi:glycosyltransferase involved in cell wall biosynthesis
MSTRRALVCAPLLPEYDRESGSQRTFHLIEFLKEAGWAVTFIAGNGRARDERYVRALQQRGVATYLEFDSGIDQLIAANRFDLAIFTFWYLAESYMSAIRKISPATRVLVDTIDLHFLRQARGVFSARERAGTQNDGTTEARPKQDARREGAFVTANPDQIPASFDLGATTISWSTGEKGTWGQVYVVVDGGPEKLFAGRSKGSSDAAWLRSGKTYEFRLYEGSKRETLLDSVIVTKGSKPGGLDSSFADRMIREINTYAAADGVLTVSQKEADLVNDLTCNPTLAYSVPDCEDLAPSGLSFADRNGILFLGNFRHPPNVGAVEYFCKDILPRLDSSLTAEHPIYIVGNALSEKVRSYGRDVPNVRMVGWVPSVLPYLERTRISVIPLLYGGGTKRKLIQALMIGTPTISTSIGVEGLELRSGEHVLVADDPEAFAESITQLLRDQELWQRLVRKGKAHIAASRSREAVRTHFVETLTAVLSHSKEPERMRSIKPGGETNGYRPSDEYKGLVSRIQQVVEGTLPPASTVVVVSKGDDELLRLDGKSGWHFPQSEDGVYAGHYPTNDEEAIAHLESLRAKGAEYLLFPATAFWWLEHYGGFKRHLKNRYRVVAEREDACLIFDLREPRIEARRHSEDAHILFNHEVP